MLPLRIMTNEIFVASFWHAETLFGVLNDSSLAKIIGPSLGFLAEVCLRIFACLLHVASDIEGIARSLGNGQPIIESNASGDSAKSDDDPPHFVDSKLADAVAGCDSLGSQERFLEA